ncbi:MAG: hypothetical protein Q7U34_00025 [Anaerolineales bacterium]|nr:hypothetical protein [Anaerolineales bacterium]
MKLAKGLKITALVLLGLVTAFLLYMGIGEIAFGDWGGIGHLIPAVVLGLLMWLAWKRPLWAGMILVVLGLVAGVRFYNPQYPDVALTVGGLPLFSGLLLLGAAWRARKAA